VADTGLSVLALCAGIGGLELGVRLAVPGACVVGYVERDAYAAAVLLARMESEELDPAPVWCGDLADLDASLFAGVDLVTAGFPCQPFSVAGKRRGEADERWIWPDIARLLRAVRPGLVFLENVPGVIPAGIGLVLGDLAEMGLDAEWLMLRASDVGAPHRRERWFCLAHSSGSGGSGSETIQEGVGSWMEGNALRNRKALAHRHEQGRGLLGCFGVSDREREASRHDADGRDEAVAHASSAGREGKPEREIDLPFPPGPDQAREWREWIGEGGPEPAIRRDADGLSDRLDRLRCLGNAVVPQQAALAFSVLHERLKRADHADESV
jgi:DNA (cytosine-5)-methyltransferase 1